MHANGDGKKSVRDGKRACCARAFSVYDKRIGSIQFFFYFSTYAFVIFAHGLIDSRFCCYCFFCCLIRCAWSRDVRIHTTRKAWWERGRGDKRDSLKWSKLHHILTDKYSIHRTYVLLSYIDFNPLLVLFIFVCVFWVSFDLFLSCFATSGLTIYSLRSLKALMFSILIHVIYDVFERMESINVDIRPEMDSK